MRGTLVDMLHMIPYHNSLHNAVLYDDVRAGHSHVLVYGAIEVHSFGAYGCIASNKTIAQEVGLSAVRVANIISELAKAKWIFVKLNENNHRKYIRPLLCIAVPDEYIENNEYDDENEFPSFSPLQSETIPAKVKGVSAKVKPIHSTDNIDNILNKKLNTSSKAAPKKVVFSPVHDSGEINSLITYFYSKIIPAVSPVFSETNRKAFDNILGLSTGVQEVRDTIDKAEKILLEPYNNNLKVSSIVAFAQKFKLIQSHVFTTKHTQTQATTKF